MRVSGQSWDETPVLYHIRHVRGRPRGHAMAGAAWASGKHAQPHIATKSFNSVFPKFYLTHDPNHFISAAIPSHLRGVSRTSRTRGGLRWTRGALLTRARTCGWRSRVVLTPRCWRQVRGNQFPLMTVARKPITGEITYKPYTIA